MPPGVIAVDGLDGSVVADEFQVLFPGLWLPVVQQWLESRDLYLAGPIPGLEDDLPTYILGIPEERTHD